jgi:hypothetical protein
MSTEEKMDSGPVWDITSSLGTYRVSETWSSRDSKKKSRENLVEIALKVTTLEQRNASLEEQLREDRAELTSLREEVKLFSTFEQVCNSGMLRNFKIDPEGDFAKVILGLLQRTMELQITHLTGPQDRRTPRLVQGATSQQEAS